LAAQETSYDGWVVTGVRRGWLWAGAGVWTVVPGGRARPDLAGDVAEDVHNLAADSAQVPLDLSKSCRTCVTDDEVMGTVLYCTMLPARRIYQPRFVMLDLELFGFVQLAFLGH
jgi:hypothetical protein